MDSLSTFDILVCSGIFIGATLGALEGYEVCEKEKLSAAKTALIMGLFSFGGGILGSCLGPVLICTSPIVAPVLLYKVCTKERKNE